MGIINLETQQKKMLIWIIGKIWLTV